ncbi:MAG: hypothetical protein JO165_09675 [Candidatus Eremiobacteraeota bacterium]|nr:hypothetical protein [Candidatus Eremiobacteraeota bacterium]
MSECVVTGIAPTSDPEELEDKFSGIENVVATDKLMVITGEPRSEAHEDSPIHFVHLAGPEHVTTDAAHDVITGSEAILTSIDGTQVPNISADSRYLGFFSEPHIVSQIGDLPIPEDERENYADALEEGHSIVVYKTTVAADSEQAEQAFKDAGLRKVKTY